MIILFRSILLLFSFINATNKKENLDDYIKIRRDKRNISHDMNRKDYFMNINHYDNRDIYIYMNREYEYEDKDKYNISLNEFFIIINMMKSQNYIQHSQNCSCIKINKYEIFNNISTIVVYDSNNINDIIITKNTKDEYYLLINTSKDDNKIITIEIFNHKALYSIDNIEIKNINVCYKNTYHIDAYLIDDNVIDKLKKSSEDLYLYFIYGDYTSGHSKHYLKWDDDINQIIFTKNEVNFYKNNNNNQQLYERKTEWISRNLQTDMDLEV